MRRAVALSVMILFSSVMFGACKDGEDDDGGVEPTLDQSETESATLTATPTPTPEPGAPGILFHSDRSGNEDVWIVQPDGSGLTQLTDAPGRDYEPRWSPGYTQIAFVSDRDGVSDGQIYVMNADGSEQRRIASSTSVDDYPNWSPDASTLIFQRSTQTGAGRISDIWSIAIDGGLEIQLTTEEAWDSTPSYSPDGSTITFESERSGNFEIWNMDADGANPRQMTNLGKSAFASRFSPDGSQVVFNLRGGGRSDIYVMNADGSEQRMLLNTLEITELCPAWSPDGLSIVYHVDNPGQDSSDLATSLVAAPGQKRLTRTPDVSEETPDWSGS